MSRIRKVWKVFAVIGGKFYSISMINPVQYKYGGENVTKVGYFYAFREKEYAMDFIEKELGKEIVRGVPVMYKVMECEASVVKIKPKILTRGDIDEVRFFWSKASSFDSTKLDAPKGTIMCKTIRIL